MTKIEAFTEGESPFGSYPAFGVEIRPTVVEEVVEFRPTKDYRTLNGLTLADLMTVVLPEEIQAEEVLNQARQDNRHFSIAGYSRLDNGSGATSDILLLDIREPQKVRDLGLVLTRMLAAWSEFCHPPMVGS